MKKYKQHNFNNLIKNKPNGRIKKLWGLGNLSNINLLSVFNSIYSDIFYSLITSKSEEGANMFRWHLISKTKENLIKDD